MFIIIYASNKCQYPQNHCNKPDGVNPNNCILCSNDKYQYPQNHYRKTHRVNPNKTYNSPRNFGRNRSQEQINEQIYISRK